MSLLIAGALVALGVVLGIVFTKKVDPPTVYKFNITDEALKNKVVEDAVIFAINEAKKKGRLK